MSAMHVPKTCSESNGLWLPIIEFSVKTGVSLSTIRRKIKSNSIQFKLEKGKYLLWYREGDSSFSTVTSQPSSLALALDEMVSMAPPPRVETVSQTKEASLPLVEDSVRMVSEAFEFAVREKDERISHLERYCYELEERLKELQLLVRVLEEKYQVRY